VPRQRGRGVGFRFNEARLAQRSGTPWPTRATTPGRSRDGSGIALITSTAVYTALAPNRFKDFWRSVLRATLPENRSRRRRCCFASRACRCDHVAGTLP
jgi:hypothetical protein